MSTNIYEPDSQPAIMAKFRQRIAESSQELIMTEAEPAEQVLRRLTKADYVSIPLAFILPVVFALCPILMPFGTPFAQDGDNSIINTWDIIYGTLRLVGPSFG